MTRRGFLKILGTAAAGTLAGCLAIEIGRDPDQFWDEPYSDGDFGISNEELMAMFNRESARLSQQLYEMSMLDSPWKEFCANHPFRLDPTEWPDNQTEEWATILENEEIFLKGGDQNENAKTTKEKAENAKSKRLWEAHDPAFADGEGKLSQEQDLRQNPLRATAPWTKGGWAIRDQPV